MLSPGQLQHPAAGAVMQNQQQNKTEAFRHAALDSSGADLGLVDSYLQQLLPALADGTTDGLLNLGLDRQSLLASGLPQHSINSLYRSLAAHAGAFKKLMGSEVQQLRQLLQAPQLSRTLQLLDGPIASTEAAQQTLKVGRTRSVQEALQAQVQQQQKLLTAAAADSIPAADKKEKFGLGPTADELVKDYADAYASMKESMEVRLRHEQRRGDFLGQKVQQSEGTLQDTAAQLDAANRRIAEQRAEAAQLQGQVAQLQSDLAASHAAHLALQQHHTTCMQAAAQEKQCMEEQHEKIVGTLQQELTAAGGAAAALAESSRQVQALRLLYNEELSRASRLAVELGRATAAADKAAAAEDSWQRQLKKSESKADNAEGMASAMKVALQQCEEELAQERAKLEQKNSHASQLRLMLERSRLAAVEQHAHARAVVVGLAATLKTTEAQLSVSQSTLSNTENALKLRMMELDGANAQLQAGRGHLKQLLSDLETEQERTANLSSDLQKMREEVDEATAQRDVAAGRVKNLQGQISKANECNAAMHDKLVDLQSQFQAQTAEFEQLQDAHKAEQTAHTALQTEATKMKAHLVELACTEQQLEHLRKDHDATEAKLELVEEENLALSSKAGQLEFTTMQLQELRQDHSALEACTDALSQQLSVMANTLNESQTVQRESAAELVLITDRLEKSEQDKAHLVRQLFDVTSAGDGAQQLAASLSQQLEMVQQSLEAAEVDRQALVAQRDAWMASFEEAYGKLQEWTVSSEAASRRLATRASAIQGAMQQLSTQQADVHAAADRKSAVGLSLSLSGSGASQAASLEAADESAAAAVTASVLDQMAGLQQLMQAETNKHQEAFENTLKALQNRVSERHLAAQASLAEAMAVSNSKRAARAAALASKKHVRSCMAAAGQHALRSPRTGSDFGGIADPTGCLQGPEQPGECVQAATSAVSGSCMAVLSPDSSLLALARLDSKPAAASAVAAKQSATVQLETTVQGKDQLLQQTGAHLAEHTEGQPLEGLAAMPDHMSSPPVCLPAADVAPGSTAYTVSADRAAAVSSSSAVVIGTALPTLLQAAQIDHQMKPWQQGVSLAAATQANDLLPSLEASTRPYKPDPTADVSCTTTADAVDAGLAGAQTVQAMLGGSTVGQLAGHGAEVLEPAATSQQHDTSHHMVFVSTAPPEAEAAPAAHPADGASAVTQDATPDSSVAAKTDDSIGMMLSPDKAARNTGVAENLAATMTDMIQAQQSSLMPATVSTLIRTHLPSHMQQHRQLQKTQLHPYAAQPQVQQRHVLQHLHPASLQQSPQVMQQPQIEQMPHLAQQHMQQQAYHKLLQQHRLLQQQHQMLLCSFQQQQQQPSAAAAAVAAGQQSPSQQQHASQIETLASVQQLQHQQQQLCAQQLRQQQPSPQEMAQSPVRPALQQHAAAQAAVTVRACTVHQHQQHQPEHGNSNESQVGAPGVTPTVVTLAEQAGLASQADITTRLPGGSAAVAAMAASEHIGAAGLVLLDAANLGEAQAAAGHCNSDTSAPANVYMAVAPGFTDVATVDTNIAAESAAGVKPRQVMLQTSTHADLDEPGRCAVTGAVAAACGGSTSAAELPVQDPTMQLQTGSHHVVTSTTTTMALITTSSISSSSNCGEAISGEIVGTNVERSNSSNRLQSTHAIQVVSISNTPSQSRVAHAVVQQHTKTAGMQISSENTPQALQTPQLAAAGDLAAVVAVSGSLQADEFDVNLSSRLVNECFPNFTSLEPAACLGNPSGHNQHSLQGMLMTPSNNLNNSSSSNNQHNSFFIQSNTGSSTAAAYASAWPRSGTDLGFNTPPAAQGSAGSMVHQDVAPVLDVIKPILQMGVASSDPLDSPSSPAVGPAGGMLSGFVSLATYQEQMESVTTLHRQVGQLAVQLREAHADADGAQQQLQQERQEATQRTTVLREALGQLHGQLEELRTDHQALQEAHRVLVAKDLMKSGLLKDRYVADLYARLQEVEWKLSIARQRACTWGFDLLVPLGRTDRGIQTQYAEIWAASQQQQGRAVSLQAKQLQIADKQQWLSECSTSPHRPVSGGSSRHQLLDPLLLADPGAGMSSTTSSTVAVALLGSPKAAAIRTAVERKQPAFACHGPEGSGTGSKDKAAGSTSRARPLSAESATALAAATSAAVTPAALSAALLSAAEQLLSSSSTQMLSAPALLQLIASLYSAKVEADATALRSHRPAQGLWEFVLKQLQRQHVGKCMGLSPIAGSSSKAVSGSKVVKVSCSSGSEVSSTSSSSGAAAALAQLLGSLQQHASSNKEVAQFAEALAASKAEYIHMLSQQGSDAARQQTITRSSNGSTELNSSSSTGNSLIKGTWGEVRLDSGKLLPAITDPEQVLLPQSVAGLLQRMLGWPGMLPLLRWVAGGHFLRCLRDGDLGKLLMDVQAPHVHFLVLEAANILGLHPLPQVHVIEAATPFVHMLQVPMAKLMPSVSVAKAKGAKGDSRSNNASQQQQELEVFSTQRQVLLVVSSAALQLLQPAELQAAMAGVLVSAVAASNQASEILADGSSSSTTVPAAKTAAKPAANNSDSLHTAPGHPQLADLVTLSSLLALQPSMLLSHLPPEMHAMGGSLAAALKAAQRVAAVVGDRGSLLVAQDLGVAMNALVRTSTGSDGVADAGSGDGRGSLTQQWMQRIKDQQNNIPQVQQLLPTHGNLALSADSENSRSSGISTSCTSNNGGGAYELDNDQVLLMRVRDLSAWAASEQYQSLMAAARPLRRVLSRSRVPSA